MRILSFLIFCLSLVFFGQKTNSPHGTDFKISCSTCHSSKGWQLDTAVYSFDHKRTKLPLKGQHITTGCRQCHKSLVFSEAPADCNGCHADIHQSTSGLDCSRCHSTFSWLVSNITQIHQTSRFPLLGAHRMADCSDCHLSASHARFDVPGVNCIDCHRKDFLSATDPNHIESGFSDDCSSCHPVNSFQWNGIGFNHSFFPLSLGHSDLACTDCHVGGNYNSLSSDCYSCHQNNYINTTNPDHASQGFSTQCAICHTTSPGWKPAKYTQHDAQFFPIYSGRHKGVWNLCTECHTEPDNYLAFDCIRCHANAHRGKNYTNEECYHCHPRGTGGD